MKPTRLAFAAAAALSAIASPAVADVAEVRWSPAGEAAQAFTVAPGKFAEWCGKLQRGDVKWSYEAAAPLEFNVHYHEGKNVHYPAKMDGAAKAQGTLGVGVDQDYCWMWTNKTNAPVTLRATATRSR
jgi:hypothetical protein